MLRGIVGKSVSQKQTIVVALLLILILGVGLRLYQLDGESLWNDELESWRQSNMATLRDVLRYGSIPDTHPPLFQAVLFFVIRYLGDSEVLLRLPSTIAGILSILAIFWLGKILFSASEGLIAAFLMSVLWVPIHYSQEARNYSFLILFSILSSAFWFLVLRTSWRCESPKSKYKFGYVFFALLTSYTHYFGLLLVIFQGLGYVFYIREKDWVKNLGIYAIVLLGYLPWVPAMIEQFSNTQRISWMDKPKLTALPAFISFSFNRIEPLAILVLLFFAFLFIRVYMIWRTDNARDVNELLRSPEFILGYWLVIPLAFTFGVSVFWKPVLTQRNLLISLPAVYLLLARSITLLPTKNSLKGIIALCFGFIPLYHMIFDMGYYRYPYKEQFREVVGIVVEESDKYPDSVIIGDARFPEYFDYYFMEFDSTERVDLIVQEEDDLAEIINTIEADRSPYFWFIAGHTYSTPKIMTLLQEEYTVIDARKFQGAAVWLIKHE